MPSVSGKLPFKRNLVARGSGIVSRSSFDRGFRDRYAEPININPKTMAMVLLEMRNARRQGCAEERTQRRSDLQKHPDPDVGKTLFYIGCRRSRGSGNH
jgi:hypothetical protein